MSSPARPPTTRDSQPSERSDGATGPGGAGEPDRAAPPNFSSSFQETTFVLVIGLSQLFSVGGLRNTAYSVEQIGLSLNVTVNGQRSWFLAAYSLCGGVFVLVTGRLGDHFGHNGFANNVVLFDFARGMTGIGNGALVPNSFALLARAFPPFSAKKNIAFAFLGFCTPSGYIFGGLIGAAFAEKVIWRWGFWFWAIGCVVLGAAALVVVPHQVGSAIPGLSLKHFDYIGGFLGVSGLILFAFAWNQASVVGWQEPYTHALLIVGFVLIVAFVVSQSHVAAPVLLNSLWTRRGFSPAVTAMSFRWMSFGIFLYYTTVFILSAHEEPPLMAVAQMYIFGVSMFSFPVGSLLMSFSNYSEVYRAFIFPGCLLVVGGLELSFASAGILVSNAVLPEEQGVAGSIVSTMVQYSIAIGLGIAATVEAHVGGNGDAVIGYRGACWLGIGRAGIALAVVVLFVRDHRFDAAKDGEVGSDSNGERNSAEKAA